MQGKGHRPRGRHREAEMTSDTKQWLLEIFLMLLAVVAMASAPARGAGIASRGMGGSIVSAK